MSQSISDSTIARMAGNIFAGIAERAYDGQVESNWVEWSVDMARKIALEVLRRRANDDEQTAIRLRG